MSNRSQNLAIGGFILGIVALIVGLTFFIGDGLFSNQKQYHNLVFESGIDGLNVGAPVSLKGVKIGEVTNIDVAVYTDSLDVLTIVTIAVDTKKIVIYGSDKLDEQMSSLVKRGLGAKLSIQSLLTGLLFVQVDHFEGETPRTVDVKTPYPQFPTVPTDMEKITSNLREIDLKGFNERLMSILAGIDVVVNNPSTQKLPQTLHATLSAYHGLADVLEVNILDLKGQLTPILTKLDRLTTNIDRQTPEILTQLQQTLGNVNESLDDIKRASESLAHSLSDDSPTIYNINNAVNELEKMSKTVRTLAETLEREPEAILTGKGE